jgi:hypothetical protein
VLAGPGRQGALTTYQGISTGELDASQQRVLWLLVEEFVNNADADAADAQLWLVQQGWADTHFAWQGPPPNVDARFYFRVHGPRILIEYDVQEPLASNGGHVHANHPRSNQRLRSGLAGAALPGDSRAGRRRR